MTGKGYYVIIINIAQPDVLHMEKHWRNERNILASNSHSTLNLVSQPRNIWCPKFTDKNGKFQLLVFVNVL